MAQNVETLTAETERGRQAIEEVMQHAYVADVDSVPARWAKVRVVDGVPVSFIVADPGRRMAFPGGDVRYAFICDVASRTDRRGEGHFRAVMEETFASLRAAGIPLVVLHGRYQLYRRFDFDVFTHHCGIFATPALSERKWGSQVSDGAEELLVIEEGRCFQEDLLLVTDVKARTLPECKAALQAAASLARGRGKTRILFEHPAAPSYGSRYPIYPSPETPLTVLARACGALVCLQGADPEGGVIPDADWIKVLDAAAFLREVLPRAKPEVTLPEGEVCFDTDAGLVTIESLGGRVEVSDEASPSAPAVKWPSSALAQLATGYQTAAILCMIHDTSLPPGAMALLNALFPQQWRFSRNESWVYKS